MEILSRIKVPSPSLEPSLYVKFQKNWDGKEKKNKKKERESKKTNKQKKPPQERIFQN